MKHLLRFLSVLLLVALAACTNEGNDIVIDDEQVPTELVFDGTETQAVESLQAFDYNFFKAVVANQHNDANVVCSPLSTSILLSMMANGVEATVQKEIAQALNCSDINVLNSISRKYLTVLPNTDRNVDFTSVNSVWYSKDYTLTSDYSATIKKYFSAPANARDFGSRQALVDEINQWCNESTNGVIEKIVDQLPGSLQALIADAVYFKGAWYKVFDKKNTRAAEFHGLSGTTSVNMMYSHEITYYKSTSECQVVRKYFGDGNFEAVFILPRQDVDTFISEADFKQISEEEFLPTSVDLYLPRFKYTPATSMNLNRALVSLGIESLDKLTDLTMFTPAQKAQYIIVHKAGIEFNEEGAVAAAVSTVNTYVSPSIGDPVEVKFDRPFVFLIRETTTGALLFAGKISDL